MTARRSCVRPGVLALGALLLSGCALNPPIENPPELAFRTQSERELQALPPPSEPVIVAVYDFPDLTGQFKPNDTFSEFSRAVTQGGVNFLVEALQEAGRGQWFVVLERAGLNNLLRERQLIRSTREQYLGEDGKPLGPPPPLLYAPILIEGGIVSYETNTYTGGLGARYLGIGGSTQYQSDRVTVSLRATSTQTGRVLRSVSVTKEIFSRSLQAGVFRFVALDKLLQVDAGVTMNEPPQLAVRRAIEKAVHALVIEGALSGFWQFADPVTAGPLMTGYLKERDGGDVSPILPGPAEPGRLAPADVRSRVEEPRPQRSGPEPAPLPFNDANRRPAAPDQRPPNPNG